jgi:guanylate kinase
MKKGKLIIFSAPSGSGKTTLVHHLLEQEALNLAFSISAASRDKRCGEVDAKDYYFISPEAFQQKIKENAFVEWEEVYKNNYYGTLKSEVERLLNECKNVIFDIDVKGGLNIKKQYPDNSLAVFVQPPSVEELRKRLQGRKTETADKIAMRIAKAEEELGYAKDFDVVVLNDDLDTAKKEVVKIVQEFIDGLAKENIED